MRRGSGKSAPGFDGGICKGPVVGENGRPLQLDNVKETGGCTVTGAFQ